MPEELQFHDRLHTPRTHEDGSLDHYQEALRHLELSEEVAVRTAEGAQVYATLAQVHATLYAAQVASFTMKASLGMVDPARHP